VESSVGIASGTICEYLRITLVDSKLILLKPLHQIVSRDDSNDTIDFRIAGRLPMEPLLSELTSNALICVIIGPQLLQAWCGIGSLQPY